MADPDQSQFTFQPGQIVRIVGGAEKDCWLGYEAQVRCSYVSYCDHGGEVAILGVLGPRPDGSDFSWFLWPADGLEVCGEAL